MPPKKGKGKKGKKAKEGDDDTKAEQKRIIDEIYHAPTIEDYPVNLEMAQKLVETENIEFFVLVQRLQEINHRLTKDTHNLLNEQEQEEENIKQQKQGLNVVRHENQKKRVRAKSAKSKLLDEKQKALQLEDDLKVENDEKITDLNGHYLPMIEEKQAEIAELQEQKRDLMEFIDNEANHQATLDFWKQQVAEQQASQEATIEAIEKERIQQIDKLRKDMLMQIRQVRMKNSVTNEDQLQGTTKLTVIQNMQLTAELDYQSKQTENLMFKNHEMKTVITNLTKDLEDHKEVEKELAKRSHFCQKVIQKYKQQIEELNKEIADTDHLQKQETKRQAQDSEQQDLMNYLNTRIQQIEQKLQTTQSHSSLQEEEYQSLLEKMIKIRNRYSKVILLLTEFIESFVEKDPSLLHKQNDIFLDIDAVKEAEDLRDVEPETLVALGLVLLKQLQPYVQDLSDQKHQQNYLKKGGRTGGVENVIHEFDGVMSQSSQIQELGGRPVLMHTKEDDQKLSFARGSKKSNYEYDERQSIPTRGQTHTKGSVIGQDEFNSQMRSSQQSVNRSDAYNSVMQNYQSAGVNSGLQQRRDMGYTTHQTGGKYSYAPTGVSRLPAVAEGVGQPQLKQNFMHLRTGGNNRAGQYSLDRSKGTGNRGRGAYQPQINSTNRRDSRLNYNSSSIPYLNKRGEAGAGGVGLGNNGVMSNKSTPIGSQQMPRRPAGYDPVRVGGNNGIGQTVLPSVVNPNM